MSRDIASMRDRISGGQCKAPPAGIQASSPAQVDYHTAHHTVDRDRGRQAAWCGWEMRRLVGSDHKDYRSHKILLLVALDLSFSSANKNLAHNDEGEG